MVSGSSCPSFVRTRKRTVCSRAQYADAFGAEAKLGSDLKAATTPPGIAALAAAEPD
jgi:hypothetical protein